VALGAFDDALTILSTASPVPVLRENIIAVLHQCKNDIERRS